MMKDKTMKMAAVVIFAAMAGLGSFVSCKKDVAVGQDDKKPEISLNKEEIEFSHEASEMYVSLESNVDWTSSSDASWITVEPVSGKAGSRKVKVSVEENAHEKGRSALVRFVAVSDEDCVAELIVNQLYKAVDPTAPYLKLDKDAIEFGADASDEYVTLETNLSWEVSKSESWIVIDPSSGDAGTKKVKISATKNNLVAPRSGRVTFADIYGKYSFDVVVSQAAAVPVETDDYIDEDGENHGKGIAIDGIVWAPVNCGHKKADIDWNGKLYQWGRKYGMENHSDTKFVTEEGPVSLEVGESKEKEGVYFSNNTNGSNWLDVVNNALWRNGTPSNPIKTQYDPCPNGWRVPTKSELSSLVKNHSTGVEYDGQRGRWFSGQIEYSEDAVAIFLPAAESWNGGGGAQWPMYWTSDVDNLSRPFKLEFDGIKGGGRCGIGYGFKSTAACIRCVKEKSTTTEK